MYNFNMGRQGPFNPKQNTNNGPQNRNLNNGRSCFPQQNAGRNNSTRPYFSDTLLILRVSQYLQNIQGRLGTRPIDFDDMAYQLQQEHKEYRRRKRAAFKHHLRKATEVIMFEKSLVEDETNLIEDDDDDVDEIEENVRGRKSPAYAVEGDGDVNSALEDSYLQQNAKKRRLSDSGAQELISIVTSDEDDDDDAPVKAAESKSSEPPPQKKEPTLTANLEDPKTPGTKRPVSPKPQPQTAKKRRKESVLTNKRPPPAIIPTVSFKDIGGNEKVLQEVTQLLIHMRHPEVYRVLGVNPPRGFLLHGPPGSGKTLLAHAISGELKVPLLKVAAPELVGGLSGQSEERIRELFEQAVALAPCVMFIDEVDAITPNRETAQREMERRIVAQLLSSMDELANTENGDQVLVIGATNRPDSLDPALRRAGRFDREVCLGIPDRESRESILRTVCGSLRLAPDLQLAEVALMTPGYVGADLKALVTEAAMAAVNRLFENLQKDKDSKSEEVRNKSELVLKDPVEAEAAKPKAMEVDSSETPLAVEVTIVVDDIKEGTDTEQTPNNKQKEDQTLKDKEDDEVIQVMHLDADDTCDEVQVLPVPEESDTPLPLPQPQKNTVQQAENVTPSLLHSAPLSREQLEGVFITKDDFKVALKAVQPSAKREGFATVPDVKWEDIGSLQDIRHDLEMAILAPVKYPQQFAQMGLHTPTGVLLCGPPGCGKTLLAKAVANEAGINFISVKGPELLNMYVGESERAVRQCFQRARSSQPCVIFFDEVDALCPKRTSLESSGASRVVNQLLTEMDGVEARPGVFLMAATNRPDIVDPAVMRPGRLDKVLYVGLPASEDRVDILRALTKGGTQPQLDTDVDLSAVAADTRCEGYTGADLAALVREASMQALKEFMATGAIPSHSLSVCARHFTAALGKIRPSVSDKDKKRYEDLRLQYAAVPATG